MARPCAVATDPLQAAGIQETTTTASLPRSRRRSPSVPLLPFVFSTLLVFLGGGIVRLAASDDANPLVPASGKLTAGGGDGGGGGGSLGAEREQERTPEGMYFFVSPNVTGYMNSVYHTKAVRQRELKRYSSVRM